MPGSASFVALVLGTIGSVGMWSYVVALPPVQADFGIDRAGASMPYTAAMIGFAFGGVQMGRFADRYGIVFPAMLGTVLTTIGFLCAGYAPNIWMLNLAHIVIGVGCSGTFGPIVSDMSHWFRKRRGIAIGIASCGNYLAGAVWPPIIHYFIESHGWRMTHIGVGIFCLVTMVPLIMMMRRPSPVEHVEIGATGGTARGTLGPQAQHLAGAARGRRHRLLRRDGDAAGAYRRLLRRPRLRPGARRRDALADARASA